MRAICVSEATYRDRVIAVWVHQRQKRGKRRQARDKTLASMRQIQSSTGRIGHEPDNLRQSTDKERQNDGERRQ